MSSNVADEFDEFGDNDALEGAIANWMNMLKHEIGHVLISHLRGGRPRSIEIARGRPKFIQSFADPSIECHDERNGCQSILLARDSSLEQSAEAFHRLEVVVAGWVIERLLGGLDRKSSAVNDLARAANLANEIAQSTGRSHDDIIHEAEMSVEELIKANEVTAQNALAICEQRLRERADLLKQLEFRLEVLSTDDLDGILDRK